MAIQQGNFLDPKQVAQLQTGMTRSQVRFLLGTPMLPDGFNRDRWDYVYYLKISQLKRPDERRLSVFFEDDKVARIENVGVPAAPAAEPASPAATEAAAGAPVAPATTAAATGAAPSPEPAAPR